MAYENLVPRLFYVRNMFFSGKLVLGLFRPLVAWFESAMA
jgi:hypothetical protein